MTSDQDAETEDRLLDAAFALGAFANEPLREYLPFGFPRELLQSKMTPEATEAELIAAENSLYCWWWKFLRADPDRYPPKHDAPDEIIELHKKFGELGDSFREWWKVRGRKVFAERRGTSVRVLYDTVGAPYEDPEFVRTVILEVVMHVPLKDVKEDIGLVLDRVHPGTKLTVYKHRDSEFPLFPSVRDDDRSYGKILEVWKAAYGLRIPNWAQIGRDVGLGTANLTTSAHRLYDRAKELINNVLRGEFPREDNKANPDDEFEMKG